MSTGRRIIRARAAADPAVSLPANPAPALPQVLPTNPFPAMPPKKMASRAGVRNLGSNKLKVSSLKKTRPPPSPKYTPDQWVAKIKKYFADHDEARIGSRRRDLLHAKIIALSKEYNPQWIHEPDPYKSDDEEIEDEVEVEEAYSEE